MSEEERVEKARGGKEGKGWERRAAGERGCKWDSGEAERRDEREGEERGAEGRLTMEGREQIREGVDQHLHRAAEVPRFKPTFKDERVVRGGRFGLDPIGRGGGG